MGWRELVEGRAFTQQRARLAAVSRWARVADRSEATRAARATFLAQFEEAPDPATARRAYFLRLAWKRWHGKKGPD